MKQLLSVKHPNYLVWGVVAFSIAVSTFVISVSQYYSQQTSQYKFDNNVSEYLDRIEKRISGYENALHSGIGFFQGSDYVSRLDWHNFVQAIELTKNYPGMQGIGFAKLISVEEKEPLTTKMKAEGFPSFSIFADSNNTEQTSVPVLYLEPMDKRNIQAIGYDIYSEPIRHAAMDLARDTGLPTISQGITLMQEIDDDVQPGILMFLPLYRVGEALDTVEQRRHALIGFVDSPFRMNDLMKQIVLDHSVLRFEIHDSSELSPAHLLYRSFDSFTDKAAFHTQKVMQLYGQTWYVDFWSTPLFDAQLNRNNPFLLIAIGFMVVYFLLLFLILYLRHAHNELRESSDFLKDSQQAAGIGSYRLDMQTMTWKSSEVLDRLLGIDAHYEHSLAGWVGLVHPDDQERMDRYFRDAVVIKRRAFDQRYRIVRQDDHAVRWVHGIGRVDFSSHGEPITMTGTIQDITDRKTSEEQIEKLAHFDQLTGLPNRTMIAQRVDGLLSQAKCDEDASLAVMFLDLDHFKDINDTLGHSVGDSLLVQIAQRIKDTLGNEAITSRSGGDEFIMVLPNVDSSAVFQMATRLITAIAQPVTVGQQHA